MSATRGLFALPEEIITTVFQHLPDADLPTLRAVCRCFKETIDGPQIALLCRYRACEEMNVSINLYPEPNTVQILSDLAIVETTCKWLSAAISDHLAQCLPPELCLPHTDFAERICRTVAPDLLETHVFLRTFRGPSRQGRGRVQPSSELCDSITSTQRMLALESLANVARTLFLLADMMHETIQHPALPTSSKTVTSIASNVFVWILVNYSLHEIDRIFRESSPADRVELLRG